MGNAVCRVLWLNVENMLPTKLLLTKYILVNKDLWCKNMVYVKTTAKGANSKTLPYSSACITTVVLYAPINLCLILVLTH